MPSDFAYPLSVSRVIQQFPHDVQLTVLSDAGRRGLAYLVSRHLYRMEQWIMPPKKQGKAWNASQWEMINYQLSEDELKAFDKWFGGVIDDVDEICANVMVEGYKIGVSYHADSGSFIGTITGKDLDDCVNRKKSMSSWHPTFHGAMLMALFKHIEVFQGGEWVAAEQTPRIG